jgi:hypothetical protein
MLRSMHESSAISPILDSIPQPLKRFSSDVSALVVPKVILCSSRAWSSLSVATVGSFKYLHWYIWLFDNVFTLGLFTSAAVALLCHKLMLLALHTPLSTIGLIFAGPFLFVFDIITLLLLYHGLRAATKRAWRFIAGSAAMFIMGSSAMFGSLYFEGNAELDWGRGVEVKLISLSLTIKVISGWKFLSKFLMEGNEACITLFTMYLLPGMLAVVVRLMSSWNGRATPQLQVEQEFTFQPRGARRLLSIPLVQFILVLLVGTIFLPANPWRHLTTTLVYDIISTISTVLITQQLRNITPKLVEVDFGSNPLGDLNYNPANDPYYITNMDEPIDAFIESALEGVQFTNVVHIILESMREDSFPYDENGLLHQHIQENMEPAENGVPVTTENVTPFIASLAENTISWHTVWSTILYTPKAMMGCKRATYIANFKFFVE